jgi:hypothetical protein
MSRKPLSPKTRFEVFKRDKFTCQYCGARAPDVVLHCDHIKPVAEGGKNDIINLATACADCNGGKGARLLSDDAAVRTQIDALSDLEDRRQQLEMMLAWRDELQDEKGTAVEEMARRIAQRTGFPLEANELADLRRWAKRYTVAELLRAIDESFDTYLRYVEDGVTDQSFSKAFSKIPAVAAVQKQEGEKPYLRQLFYIQGIVRKRARAPRYQCVEYLEHVHLCGMGIDEIERRAKRMSTLEDFEQPLDAWLEEIGRPY